MKNTKRLYYVILLVASAAFIGCQREDLHVMIPDNDVKEIYVTAEIPIIEQGPVYLEEGQSYENAHKYYFPRILNFRL